MSNIKKSYWSVIPANVRYSKKIPDGAKLLYSEITSLCNEKGFCWANNEYFSNLYGNDKRTVQRWISSLANENFIYVDNTIKRKIFLSEKLSVDLGEIDDEDDTEEIKQKPVKKKVKNKKIEKIQKYKYTDDDLFMAELLFQKIIFNFPLFENKKINIKDWADDIRKLREIDNASKEQIIFMINWLQGGELEVAGKPKKIFKPHDFWCKNILSAGKLRSQWFTLIPQVQSQVKKNTTTQL